MSPTRTDSVTSPAVAGDFAGTHQKFRRRVELAGLDRQKRLHCKGVSQLRELRGVAGFGTAVERCDSLRNVVVGDRAVAVVPLIDRQRMVVGADGDVGAHRLPYLDRAATRHDRVVEAVGEVVLGCEQFEQLGFGLDG